MTLLLLISINAKSQEMALKAGVAYTSAATVVDESIGFMFGFTFIEKKVELSADFNYYIDEAGDQLYTPYAFNFDARYVTHQLFKERLDLFPIIGVNYSDIYFRELGLNLGLGSRFDINKKLSIFSELKYVFGNLDGTTYNIGIQIKP